MAKKIAFTHRELVLLRLVAGHNVDYLKDLARVDADTKVHDHLETFKRLYKKLDEALWGWKGPEDD